MKALRALRDRDIDLSDIPEGTPEEFSRARVLVGSVEVPRKKRVSIMLDTVLIARFKREAGGRGYQTLINEVLREHFRRGEMLADVRRAVREEFAARTDKR
jgi:uncharacterized protein (DUF4415 family)